jgi:hypothetical protein
LIYSKFDSSIYKEILKSFIFPDNFVKLLEIINMFDDDNAGLFLKNLVNNLPLIYGSITNDNLYKIIKKFMNCKVEEYEDEIKLFTLYIIDDKNSDEDIFLFEVNHLLKNDFNTFNVLKRKILAIYESNLIDLKFLNSLLKLVKFIFSEFSTFEDFQLLYLTSVHCITDYIKKNSNLPYNYNIFNLLVDLIIHIRTSLVTKVTYLTYLTKEIIESILCSIKNMIDNDNHIEITNKTINVFLFLNDVIEDDLIDKDLHLLAIQILSDLYLTDSKELTSLLSNKKTNEKLLNKFFNNDKLIKYINKKHRYIKK